MFEDLDEHIQGTFAAFSGAEEYEAQLSIWCHMARARAAERAQDNTAKSAVKRWQSANRKRMRGYDAKWRASLPANTCWCKAPVAPGRKKCQRHLDDVRQRVARYAAAKRAEQARRAA